MEQEKTEAVLRERIVELDRAIESMSQRRDAWKILLTEYFEKEV